MDSVVKRSSRVFSISGDTLRSLFTPGEHRFVISFEAGEIAPPESFVRHVEYDAKNDAYLIYLVFPTNGYSTNQGVQNIAAVLSLKEPQ